MVNGFRVLFYKIWSLFYDFQQLKMKLNSCITIDFIAKPLGMHKFDVCNLKPSNSLTGFFITVFRDKNHDRHARVTGIKYGRGFESEKDAIWNGLICLKDRKNWVLDPSEACRSLVGKIWFLYELKAF